MFTHSVFLIIIIYEITEEPHLRFGSQVYKQSR